MLIYGGSVVDHRTPVEDRWGGWFVTGAAPTVPPRGKRCDWITGRPEGHGITPDHQMHMINLITRIGWDTRAGTNQLLAESAREFVDYLLFVDEAPVPRGNLTSRFAASFGKNAPRDSKGRSLYDLDLHQRLLRYPCSYMIYSDAFDALPSEAKDAIYKRMVQIVSGADKDRKYARLSAADRRAILEILRETKKDFPTAVK